MPSLFGNLSLLATPLISLALVLALGRPVMGWLRRMGAGQRVRDDGPQRHLEKEGTPTMGGLLILVAAGIAAAVGTCWIWPRLSSYEPGAGWRARIVIGSVAFILASACVGLADDWKKVRRGRSLGLRAREKLLVQFIVSAAFAALLVWWRASGSAHWHFSVWYTSPVLLGQGLLWTVAMVAAANAANLADGLDGLEAGLCVISSLGFAVLGLKGSQPTVAILALALAGACLGFLWFNRHPARVFMGDVGSLGLGAAMAAMAAQLNLPLALGALCLVPFVEMVSVVIQVISFKTTGRRVFRMSPIHHHFELSGWSERKVVHVFWLVQAAAAGAVLVWYLTR
jgi:phospho-N-acetylmuramoyl-pentapeptide-transferase